MEENQKIKTINELELILSKERSHAQCPPIKVVLCHGVFDLLHVGHIRYFEQAKKHGDILVVTVTPDRFVNKGPNRPAFSETLRAEAIASLGIVDYVAINEWPTAVETIHILKPDIYAKGVEYKNHEKDITGKIADEENAIKSIGGKIVFTEDIVFSSTALINNYLSEFSEDLKCYIKDFFTHYTADEVIAYLKNTKNKKVLVIGEAIIDEYQYCEPIGMATKDPIIAVRYLSKEKFAGGIIAVANHVASFCDTVGMVAMLGEQDTDEDFVRKHMKNNINPLFFYKKSSPTIVKRRFIDSYLMQKLFEVHSLNDNELDSAQSNELNDLLKTTIPKYDIIIVVDFGHGMMTNQITDTICDKAKFLAVNTQTNSGNRGFNVISKYPRADYICLNHSEINLEERTRDGDLKTKIRNVSKKMSCNKLLVTKGRYGNICYDSSEGFAEVPAFAQKVVDRMGAGDAVISITSLCVASDAPMKVVGFVANAVATQAVATLGHSSSTEPISLFKYITTLSK
jgi:rfaE bifunctional protein kinase chain/domain/rfaE bifunctional protein nucleotidyltransferase chain/domain